MSDTPNQNIPLLEVKNLRKHFPIRRGFFFTKTVGAVKAVDDVSFFIKEKEALGLVGESGCGKTTTGRLILRAHEPTGGEVLFNDCKLGRVNIAALAVHPQMVVCDEPVSALV